MNETIEHETMTAMQKEIENLRELLRWALDVIDNDSELLGVKNDPDSRLFELKMREARTALAK